MAPHFGPDIVGPEEFARQVEQEKGGGNTFGPLVTGKGAAPEPMRFSRPDTPHVRQASANTHGKDVVGDGAQAVATVELEQLLAENPSHFDGLYEAEMARASGPRVEALELFQAHELRTLARPTILAEIDTVLQAVKGRVPEISAKKGGSTKGKETKAEPKKEPPKEPEKTEPEPEKTEPDGKPTA